MYMTKVLSLFLVLLCCELCLTIKVPVVWNGANSEVKQNEEQQEAKLEAVKTEQKSIPVEYFEYNVPKPKFAVEVAKFHGVHNPQEHYKAYPIKPYTNKEQLPLGIHHMLDEDKKIYQPYQKFVNKNESPARIVKPAITGYEIFHPYKAEEPALQKIYKDPVFAKIQNDLLDSKNRLQAYEKEVGKPHITNDEYLEGPDETDRRLFPQPNIPARYEIHRPERRPVYYKAPVRYNHREQVLNQKFKHPLNQNYVKIKPVHYQPLKNHLQQLRQHHASKYDDEHNEYPQVHPIEKFAEPENGYDIYERGRQKYTQMRNNVDESINKAVKQNTPAVYQKLELQNDEIKNEANEDDEDEEEFVPVKNYAQVRKTEVTKHLPREAALEDAETLEEIINAPRLREAIKSQKAQTVYSEEGYEDSAYDHAGEHKHASDHEGHGGYLKENQLSGGVFKIPSESGNYEDGRGSEYRDKTLHGEKWKNDNKDNEEETEDEDYSEIESEQSVRAKIYKDDNPNETSYRNKREGDEKEGSDDEENSTTQNDQTNESNTQHEVDKREINFKVPEINFTSTYLTEADILKLAKQKILPKHDKNINKKYPYYSKDLKGVHKNSPLRYAENLKYIPKKSKGGTEFYDSRSKLECPDVEDVDPIPEKLKNGQNPTKEETSVDVKVEISKEEKNFERLKEQPRLKGLGDKIDCFKAKYFGENPLDSPFFKEETISNPEPVTVPNLATYKLNKIKERSNHESNLINVINATDTLHEATKTDVFILLDKLRTDQNKLQESLLNTNTDLKAALYTLPTATGKDTQQANVYSDILQNIKYNILNSTQNQINANTSSSLLDSHKKNPNITYNFYQNKEDITKPPSKLRKKRATPFVYEPYKIIRDGQVQDSKKTTTSSNISPLIKQLQSSKVIDKVTKSNQESDKLVKRNTNTRTYVDIGRKDREKTTTKGNTLEATIVDVSVDQRRGEPRYEIRPANHKTEYTPVENKKSMSVEDFKALNMSEKSVEASTAKNENKNSTQRTTRTVNRLRQRKTTVRPYYDVAQYIPKPTEVQNVAASNTVNVRQSKTVTSLGSKSRKPKQVKNESQEDSEESEEVYDDEEIVTTTTTPRPSIRRRIRPTTTTQRPKEEETTESDFPKLRLVTRFRDYKPSEKPEIKADEIESPSTKKYKEEYDISGPKYREKKKKSSTSTIVTDTKKYGGEEDDDDDTRREEVDALIGVKESLEDYIPSYEKEAKNRRTEEDHSIEDESDEDDDEDEDVDEEDDDNEDDEEEEEEPEVRVTTPEPTKRTLVRTTDAPTPTTASRSAKLEAKPIVTKKKIEIHKETPVNKSSPHVSQFKQDIEEVEIIKEIPSISKKKSQKNAEALELYKDDNLAKDVNKLGDVEIFSENIDIDKGPKHGGNYRIATKEDLKLMSESIKAPKDAIASQSENTKHVELDEYVPKRMHGGNLKSIGDVQRSRNTGRSSKLIEFNDPPVRGMHGGNLRYGNKGRRGGRRNEKLVEIDDDRDDEREDSSSSRENNFKTFNSRDRMHGGNYRSAKIVQAPEKLDEDDIKVIKGSRKNTAGILSSFAQAAPVLTTTPGYILDPSKRMYYYVDA